MSTSTKPSLKEPVFWKLTLDELGCLAQTSGGPTFGEPIFVGATFVGPTFAGLTFAKLSSAECDSSGYVIGAGSPKVIALSSGKVIITSSGKVIAVGEMSITPTPHREVPQSGG